MYLLELSIASACASDYRNAADLRVGKQEGSVGKPLNVRRILCNVLREYNRTGQNARRDAAARNLASH